MFARLHSRKSKRGMLSHGWSTSLAKTTTLFCFIIYRNSSDFRWLWFSDWTRLRRAADGVLVGLTVIYFLSALKKPRSVVSCKSSDCCDDWEVSSMACTKVLCSGPLAFISSDESVLVDDLWLCGFSVSNCFYFIFSRCLIARNSSKPMFLFIRAAMRVLCFIICILSCIEDLRANLSLLLCIRMVFRRLSCLICSRSLFIEMSKLPDFTVLFRDMGVRWAGICFAFIGVSPFALTKALSGLPNPSTVALSKVGCTINVSADFRSAKRFWLFLTRDKSTLTLRFLREFECALIPLSSDLSSNEAPLCFKFDFLYIFYFN